MPTGIVKGVHGGFCTVEAEGRTYLCRVRKSLKRRFPFQTSPVAVGDRVEIALNGDQGVVEAVGERRTLLQRRAAGRTGAAQLIAANADRLVVVLSTREPRLGLGMADRLFCAAEDGGLECALVINKLDLVDPDEVRPVAEVYSRIGYEVCCCSAVEGTGLDDVKRLLEGGTSVLCGPSGVGKSTLLNRIQPGLGLRTNEVSRATGKGRHTTTVAEMFEVPSLNARVIDTPGLREVGLWDVRPEELASLFPEMRPHLGRCRFSGCTHSHEPGCAVKEAVERGEVSRIRYDSYLRILDSLGQRG